MLVHPRQKRLFAKTLSNICAMLGYKGWFYPDAASRKSAANQERVRP
jgi:hypothetical protein